MCVCVYIFWVHSFHLNEGWVLFVSASASFMTNKEDLRVHMLHTLFGRSQKHTNYHKHYLPL